ncbi:MAG: uracil-DNA glycosylase [Coriobacteriia bacterium]|nr:uracil-DNA glycosylase [Coriobacteriia bacterium]
MNEQLPEIEQLGLQAADCRRCELAAKRTQVVWGDGPATARAVFIGEAPGRKEDEGGRPFIGAAGHLLDELLAAAHITRADVYITNIVKCRPPGNRDPLDDEIVACRGYLNRQLQLLHPRVIVTLGRFSTHLILQTTAPISSLQGRVFERHGYKVLPLYHPAAAIYDLMKKEPLFAAAPILDALVNAANTDGAGDAPAPAAERPEKAPVEPSQRSKGELGEPSDALLGAPPVPTQQAAPAPAPPAPTPQSPHFTQETLDIWNA